MAFKIIRNDITKVMADAIVNTANPDVTIGDGVDSAIYEAAGKQELLHAREEIGCLDIGEVGITPAFKLKAKYIIHSSGPYWTDGKHGEEKLLRQCYDKSLLLAYQHGCKSIAFPLMATGTYGFPQELGLQIALEAFNAFLLQYEMEIILVVFGETAYKISGKIFDDVQAYVDDSYVNEKLQKEYCHDEFVSETKRADYNLCAARKPERIEKQSFLSRRRNARRDAAEFVGREDAAIYSPRISSTTQKLDDYMQQESGSFGTYLQQLINKKCMKNSEVYTAANLTKQYFSKLLNGKVTPSKAKILSLAVALRLNMDETIDFLRMSGYAFSPFSQVDKIFEYFIRNEMYDIYKIDIVLFDYGLPTLIND